MKTTLFFCTIALGILAILTQVLLIRDFLALFSGNELVVGLILGNWLLLSGIGCLIPRFIRSDISPYSTLPVFFSLLALLPPLQIIVTRSLTLQTLPGEALGATEAFLSSAAIMAPFCVLSGALLTILSQLASVESQSSWIGRIYTADCIGTAIGGALFSFLLVELLQPLEIAGLMICIALSAGLLSLRLVPTKNSLGRISLLCACILGSALFSYSTDLERQTIGWRFKGQQLLELKNSRYGRIALTEQNKQLAVYQNGLPLGSSDDTLGAEESSHYALSQRPRWNNVLVIAGGISGILQEVSKHEVAHIHYVELDPTLGRLVAEQLRKLELPKVSIHFADARQFLASSNIVFDAIITAIPDPSTAALNRFYTVDFFQLAKQSLSPTGVLSISLVGSENYASAELRQLEASVWNSLNHIFFHTLLIPGSHNFFLGSSAPLTYEIVDNLNSNGISTHYINIGYLSAKLTSDRLHRAQQSLNFPSKLNLDLAPFGYFAYLRHWLSQMGSSLWAPGLVLLVALVSIALLLITSPTPALHGAIATTGFASMGLSLILIFGFQMLYGSLYADLSVIITAFMLGSALGGIIGSTSKCKPYRYVTTVEFLLVITSLLLGLVLKDPSNGVTSILQDIPEYCFSFLNLFLGLLVGLQFAAASHIHYCNKAAIQNAASRLFALDFLGSYIGAISLGAFLIPLLGVGETALVLSALKAFSAISILYRRKEFDSPSEDGPKQATSPNIVAVVLLAAFVATGIALSNTSISSYLYSLSFRFEYHWATIFLLAWGIARVIKLTLGPKSQPAKPDALAERFAILNTRAKSATGFSIFRLISFVVFCFTAVTPLFRCYFSIPYLFCHVCPRKCVFGYLRPYIIPGALIMNLENRHWCHHACPIGTVHDCQSRLARRIANIGSIRWWTAIAALIFTIVAYFKVQWDIDTDGILNGSWYLQFFNNTFSAHAILVAVVCVLFVLGFFFRRPFCLGLCPLGNTSELLMNAERLIIDTTESASSKSADVSDQSNDIKSDG